MKKVLHTRTADLISKELESIPEKYAKSNFASTHEAIAVIREEYLELEKEVFWGEKEALETYAKGGNMDEFYIIYNADILHKKKMKAEAVQLASMCVRFIQECC